MGSASNTLYQKIESFVNRLSSVYLEIELDMIKLNRASAVYVLLLKIVRLSNEKTAKQLEIIYMEYEKSIGLKDGGGEFGFLKPFFKEQYHISLCLSNRCKLRTFMYNFTITGDYYGTKLIETKNNFYTQYFNMICFSFHKKMLGIWPNLSHFTTQTIAKYKSQSDRHEFAIMAFIKFINCYTQSDSLQEGSAESLRSYLNTLSGLINLAIKSDSNQGKSTFDLDKFLLFKMNFNFSVSFFEEQQSRFCRKSSTKTFDYSEFSQVLEKHVDIYKLKTCPDFQQSMELLYCTETSEKRALLYDKVRETFKNETVQFLVVVKNFLKV